jgi:hypothetical protein
VAKEVKGVLSAPFEETTMAPTRRDALIYAIAKARAWIDDLAQGRVASFAEIATQEGKVEDHVRFLARLAFVSPAIVSAIIDGSVPANIKVTRLAKGLGWLWKE